MKSEAKTISDFTFHSKLSQKSELRIKEIRERGNSRSGCEEDGDSGLIGKESMDFLSIGM